MDDAVAKAQAVVASVAEKVEIPTPITDFFTAALGDDTPTQFLLEWGPIMYVTLGPLLCMFCACCFAAKEKKQPIGSRILKRIKHASSAINKLAKAVSPKKGAKKGAGYSPVDVEKGKSPIKDKAKNVKEEAAIKKKAAKK